MVSETHAGCHERMLSERPRQIDVVVLPTGHASEVRHRTASGCSTRLVEASPAETPPSDGTSCSPRNTPVSRILGTDRDCLLSVTAKRPRRVRARRHTV